MVEVCPGKLEHCMLCTVNSVTGELEIIACVRTINPSLLATKIKTVIWLWFFLFRKECLCFVFLSRSLSLKTWLAVTTSLQRARAKAAFLFRNNLQMLFLSLEDLDNRTKWSYYLWLKATAAAVLLCAICSPFSLLCKIRSNGHTKQLILP